MYMVHVSIYNACFQAAVNKLLTMYLNQGVPGGPPLPPPPPPPSVPTLPYNHVMGSPHQPMYSAAPGQHHVASPMPTPSAPLPSQQTSQPAQTQSPQYRPTHERTGSQSNVNSPHLSSANIPSPTPSAASHHSHSKKHAQPKLRVQIPGDSPKKTGHQHNASVSSISSTASGRKEDEDDGKTFARPATPQRPTVSTSEPGSALGPPSALPSQFAQNLPSPSTFYPEFYQQSELPSPLNFSATPTAGNTFHWPPPPSSSSGGRDYRPSPLAKLDSRYVCNIQKVLHIHGTEQGLCSTSKRSLDDDNQQDESEENSSKKAKVA